MLTSEFFHRKSAKFVTSRSTDIDCREKMLGGGGGGGGIGLTHISYNCVKLFMTVDNNC